MFVYSFRASTLKFVGVVLLSTVLLIGLLTLIPSHAPTAASLMYSGVSKINFSKVKTNEDRIAFLSQFGWTVDSTPVEEKEVTIPDEFDRVFTAYNDLQKQQGLDLSRYRRKKVMRYASVLPQDTYFTWEDIGHFKKTQYMLMHSIIYRQ